MEFSIWRYFKGLGAFFNIFNDIFYRGINRKGRCPLLLKGSISSLSSQMVTALLVLCQLVI
jgi:hypothetical protein